MNNEQDTQRMRERVNDQFETNFVFCETAVAVARVDCGSICKLLSVDNSSSGRVGLDDAPVIAYANAAFVTLFWRRRRLCVSISVLCVCFCRMCFVWVCVCVLEWWGVSGRSHWAVVLELIVFYCCTGSTARIAIKNK